MATQRTKKVSKPTPKSQTKTKKATPKAKKPVMVAVKKTTPPPQPVTPQPKAHPFAAFVQSRPSYHNNPTAVKFGRHDIYRKKAI